MEPNYLKALEHKSLLICGTLFLNSSNIYKKKKFTLKKFKSHETFMGHDFFYVKISNPAYLYQPYNMYVVIRYVGMIEDMPIGEINTHIGNVGVKEAELEYLKEICKCHWVSDKYFKNIEIDLFPDRERLVDCEIYSIDPKGCVDIDDAIHAKQIGENYEIGVHIADVTSFIPTNSLLDKELQRRVETIYLKKNKSQTLQINLLPEYLLKKCSLIENKDRRAFSMIFLLDREMKIINHKCIRTLIQVKKNYSYEQATDCKKLSLIYDIGKHIYNNLKNDISTYDTHKMVEAYMLLANIYVAQILAKKTPDKVILRSSINNSVLSEKKEEKHEQFNIPQSVIDARNRLISLRAEYRVGIQDVYHSNLNQQFYTHFTSPIRRYVDMGIHRLLSGENIDIDVKNINVIHKKYDLCQKMSEYNNIIYDIFENNIQNNIIQEAFTFILSGHIINMDVNKFTIFIKSSPQCPNFSNKIIEVPIFSKKLEKIFKTVIEDNKLIVKNDNPVITFNLYQKVKIKMTLSLYSSRKTLFSIYEPDIGQLLYEPDVGSDSG